MTADQLIQYLAWIIYVLIFASAAIGAIRRPLRPNIDIALLFLAPTLIIALTVATVLKWLPSGPGTIDLTVAGYLAIAYLSLRLVDDFTEVSPWLMHGAEAAFVLLVLATILFPTSQNPWLALLLLAYLIGLFLYVTGAFMRASQRSGGVTKRRMRAAAAGSLALVADFGFSGLTIWFPQLDGLWSALSEVAGLVSSVCYFLGFAPPGLLRRAWQEPELRAFLGRAARLPRLPDTASIIKEMEQGAATSLGAPHAAIGLWDAAAEALRFNMPDGELVFPPDSISLTGRAFLTQHALFSANLQRDIPATAAVTRAAGATALLAAPITAGENRLGVLTVYAPNAPIFAEEDLALVQLLADQAAVILESRTLIDEAARVQAREEVTRLKEDFLSAAAHDLKTPLTTLVGLTQLLERKVLRQPDAPVDLASIQKLVKEVQRLRTLVLELLDAARTEQGQLVGTRSATDLISVAQETCARHESTQHPFRLDAPGPVVGQYDPIRIQQLFENLLENAVKYSPAGGPVGVKVWREDGWNHVTVSDQGIGIPIADLPHIFERFHRGTNVNDRRFAGMGLGLYICRGIAEQHGGRISVQTPPNGGTTFHVMLPAGAPTTATEGASHA
jgi:signal transduction histidine kinase